MLNPKNKKIISSCFDTPSYDHRHSRGEEDSIGWCATCVPDAKFGERGYCGHGEQNNEEEAPIIYPNSTNWGFCDPKCIGRDPANMIQVRSNELLTVKSNCVPTISVHWGGFFGRNVLSSFLLT